ncbi:hypothetical protein Bequi_02890 [Brachybacterium sp. JHP9]|uniref:Uncharacterized protein n=1 Tax=Brachybacterium equifaecis TaxID=2910770 RepID=A0ABT0QXD8_9MICO|nr:hypothetical protein [Brachybacterium equifaecis]
MSGAAAEIAQHRLELPAGTDPAAVLAMIRSVRPDAREDLEGIDLGGGARLVQDAATPSVWTLHAPRSREAQDPHPPPDSRGYARAFPLGIPFGEERELLDLAVSLARRFRGAVVTDGGERLAPHPFSVRDLSVVSPNPLIAGDLLALLQAIEPEAHLEVPPPGVDTTGYVIAIPLSLRAQDDAALSFGTDPTQIGLPADEREDDELLVRLGPSVKPVALAAVPWLRRAVDYQIVHLLADEPEESLERPSPEIAARWEQVYRRAGRIAGVIVEAVGGYVVDLEGFLVDPADLV